MAFSTARLCEAFAGRLTLWQWVMLAGASAIALRQGRMPTEYTPAGVKRWLVSSHPAKWKRGIDSSAQAWDILTQQLFEEVPESAFAFDVLHAMTSELQAVLASGDLREIADDLVRVWLGASDASDDAPLPQITTLMLDLTRTKSGQYIRCVGRGAEAAAIECLQSGRIPVVESQPAPVMALIYALLLDLPLQFDEFGVDRDIAAEILVPDRFLPNQHSEALVAGMREAATPSVVLVPNRILFARATVSRELRRALVESQRLRAIIGFPQGTLTEREAPFSILWFDREATVPDTTAFAKADEELHFDFARGQLRTRTSTFTGGKQIIDAIQNPIWEEPWARHVSHQEIAENDYLLTADRYLGTEVQLAVKRAASCSPGRLLVTLQDLVTVIKAQTFRTYQPDEGASIAEVTPGEFPPHGFLDHAPRVRLVDPSDLTRFKDQFLKANDVLLSTKGTIGRVAIVARRDSSLPMVPSASTVILRMRKDSSPMGPIALFMYLRSPLFQAQLRSIVVGTTIPNISLFDLRKLQIVLPSVEEQRSLQRAFEDQGRLQAEIQRLQNQQDTIGENAWKSLDLWTKEKGP